MNAIAKVAAAVVARPDTAEACRLKVFRLVPCRHGVAVLEGLVLIYDEEEVRRFEMEEGALYVIEHQRMPPGMHPESYHRQSLDHLRRRDRAIQLQTEREVVRIARWARDPECWQYTRADGFTEYPLYEWGLASMIVGRVVGLYAPAPAEH